MHLSSTTWVSPSHNASVLLEPARWDGMAALPSEPRLVSNQRPRSSVDPVLTPTRSCVLSLATGRSCFLSPVQSIISRPRTRRHSLPSSCPMAGGSRPSCQPSWCIPTALQHRQRPHKSASASATLWMTGLITAALRLPQQADRTAPSVHVWFVVPRIWRRSSSRPSKPCSQERVRWLNCSSLRSERLRARCTKQYE